MQEWERPGLGEAYERWCEERGYTIRDDHWDEFANEEPEEPDLWD